MIKWFIKHQWKQMTRSTIFQKNVVVNIVLGFFFTIILLEILVGGIVLADKWQEIFPDQKPIASFNSFILYYFGVMFIMRFLIQGMPIMTVQPYLHLPVKKRAIVHYILVKAKLNLFNILPLFFIVPFAIFQMKGVYTTLTIWVWIFSVVFLEMFNNYLVFYVKKQMAGNMRLVIIVLLSLAVFGVLDYMQLLSIREISSTFFGAIIANPSYGIIPLALFLAMYYVDFSFLRSRMYPEEMRVKKDQKVDALNEFRYLKSLGSFGEIVGLELKLIWRHKRTRSIVFMIPVFLLYGFIFYPQDIYMETWSWLIFVGIFMTGGMMINYTTYAFSYESNYFDGILANNIDMHQYFKVKYTIAVIICTVCYILTLPYGFFALDVILINTATYLFNMGVLAFVLLFMATYNKKRMDLSKGAMFNYQGLNASNWLAMLPAFLGPVLIYLPFGLFGFRYIGIGVVALIGLTGILFHKSLIKMLVKQFNERKYKMAEGFRQNV